MALKAQAKAMDKLLLEAKRKQQEEEDFQLFGNELLKASPAKEPAATAPLSNGNEIDELYKIMLKSTSPAQVKKLSTNEKLTELRSYLSLLN